MEFNRLKILLSQIRNSENKKGILVLVLLLVILPVVIILASSKTVRNFLYRSSAAPNATMSLVPQGVTQNGQGNWQFQLNQNVDVNVVIQTGATQVEIGEAVIKYNPAKLSAQNVNCSPSSPLSHPLTANDPSVSVIKRDGSNNELGIIEIACVSFNPPYPTNSPQFDPNWQLPVQVPILANTTATLATVTFKSLALSANNTDLIIDYTAASPGNLNDSNLIAPLSAPVTTPGTDILASVNAITFDVVPQASITPTVPAASPTPSCLRKTEGDANCDGNVSISDFGIWKNEFTAVETTKNADFNSDGSVTISDFGLWKNTFAP